MRYHVEITKTGNDYQAALYQDGRAIAARQRAVHLGPQAEINIKGEPHTLGAIVQAIIDYGSINSQTFFDERAQLEIGRYLFAQIFGELTPRERQALHDDKVDVRLVTAAEHIGRLPWALLADDAVFLTTAGWSVSLARTMEGKDLELPPSPKILIVAPEPEGIPATNAAAHLEKLEDLLSGADQRHQQGRNLRVVKTWEEFKAAAAEFQPHIIYYYGHGVGDANATRLIFASGKKMSRVDKPLPDVANALQDAPLRLVYINCCQGDAGGCLGVGWQLSRIAPAVLTNRTTAWIEAAQAQALAFWRSVLIDGEAPHTAVAEMYGKLGDLDLTTRNIRWMTPVLHAHYQSWKANPPQLLSRLEFDPLWRLKLDRTKQFGQLHYLTTQMLQERKPKAHAFVWYGKEQQGVDLFHKRLKAELQERLPDTFVYEVLPEWPADLAQPHRSFSDMMCEAFAVETLDHIPGRIRTENRGVSGRRTLVYVNHRPVRSAKLINTGAYKKYLEWWDYNFTPLLEAQIYALLGVSFVVANPDMFKRAVEEKDCVGDLDLARTVFNLLDEMGDVVKKDLLDFLKTHNINLPDQRRDRILEEILAKTNGNYEATLEELKDAVARAWDLPETPAVAPAREQYDY